jgi:hypothetical protein
MIKWLHFIHAGKRRDEFFARSPVARQGHNILEQGTALL